MSSIGTGTPRYSMAMANVNQR